MPDVGRKTVPDKGRLNRARHQNILEFSTLKYFLQPICLQQRARLLRSHDVRVSEMLIPSIKQNKNKRCCVHIYIYIQ